MKAHKQVSVAMDTDTLKRLDYTRIDLGVTRSALVVTAVKEYLANHAQDAQPVQKA